MCNRFTSIDFYGNEEAGNEADASSEVEGDILMGFFSVFDISVVVKHEVGVVEGEIVMEVRMKAGRGGFSLVPVEDLKADANMNFDISPSTRDFPT